LPGDATGAAAASERPGKRLFLQNVVGNVEAIMPGIGPHHVEIVVLAAVVEPDPQAEAVRERELLLHRFARIDGGRALVVDHLAGHQMPPVRGRIKEDVGRPSFDAAFEHGFERLIGRVARLEGEIVAEQDEALPARRAQMAQEVRQ
jgi:hypothetical protein